mmetsp:Transcript_45955/g.127553  ORF Transcript_45955/g.127553 Transcript_45955/m.127553 type:complete len:415 (-) Transcript_45955:168-1412(-)
MGNPERVESDPPPSDNLYVWNLPAGADDTFLRQLFGQVGTVKSVKAIKEKRYGFVRFSAADEAAVAINLINGVECEGTFISVKYANPKGWVNPAGGSGAEGGAQGGAGSGGGGGWSNAAQYAAQHFSEHDEGPVNLGFIRLPNGTAVSLDGQILEMGHPAGVVTTRTPGSFGVSTIPTNGAALGPGNQLKVRPGAPPKSGTTPLAVPKPRPGVESNPPPSNNLYVWNLPAGFDDNFLIQLFSQVGNVLSVKAITDRRYGFVRFSTVDEAQLAINSVNGLECEGTRIAVKYANLSSKAAGADDGFGGVGATSGKVVHPPSGLSRSSPYPAAAAGQDQGSTNVYVYQLPVGSDDSTLMQLFGTYGSILSVKCLTDRRYGFVKMGSVEEAEAAIEGVNNLRLENTTVKCHFANRDRQ